METPLMTLSQTVDIDIHSISLFKLRRETLHCVQIYYTVRPDPELRCHQIWRRLPHASKKVRSPTEYEWGVSQWTVHKVICEDHLKEDEEEKYRRTPTTWLELLLIFGTSKDEFIEMFKQDVIYG